MSLHDPIYYGGQPAAVQRLLFGSVNPFSVIALQSALRTVEHALHGFLQCSFILPPCPLFSEITSTFFAGVRFDHSTVHAPGVNMVVHGELRKVNF
jgi:hypothetical protein